MAAHGGADDFGFIIACCVACGFGIAVLGLVGTYGPFPLPSVTDFGVPVQLDAIGKSGGVRLATVA